MTLREQLQAELVVAEAKVAELKSHLASSGAWLEMEVGRAKEELAKLWAYLHPSPSKPTVSPSLEGVGQANPPQAIPR